MWTAVFWKAAAERALKSVAQVLIVLWAGDGPLNAIAIDWRTALGLALGAALLSVMFSILSYGVGPNRGPSLTAERLDKPQGEHERQR